MDRRKMLAVLGLLITTIVVSVGAFVYLELRQPQVRYQDSDYAPVPQASSTNYSNGNNGNNGNDNGYRQGDGNGNGYGNDAGRNGRRRYRDGDGYRHGDDGYRHDYDNGQYCDGYGGCNG